MDPTATIPSHLQNLFQSIRQAVTFGNPEEWGQLGRNAKGDSVKWFDVAADQAACTYLAEKFPFQNFHRLNQITYFIYQNFFCVENNHLKLYLDLLLQNPASISGRNRAHYRLTARLKN